ncbi:MAG: DUF1501 domain-containing protein [Pirellulaceae bacterium]|jgi:hypothetical protein|nr:DUF1501 domain-containing protein [Pirellulaceae bacterium]
MLKVITGGSSRQCDGRSRREFLRVGACGLTGLALPTILDAEERAARAVRGKSVVVLFLTGGPSQIETFDPKLSAPSEYRSVTGGQPSKLAGVAYGGTFAQLAQRADRLAVVRSFTHGEANHTKAVEQVIRGGNPINHAGMGSIAASLRGTSHPDTGMPTHVYLAATEVDRQFNKERLRLLEAAGPGGLGGAYAPFEAGGDSRVAEDMEVRIPRRRLDDRLALSRSLDRLNRQVDAQRPFAAWDKFTEQALDLVLGKSRLAFDLTSESPELLARYDTSEFVTGIHTDRRSTLGRQLLLARRLCEAGCGFVTVHNPGWDMHGGPTQYNMPKGMESLGRPVDKAVAAFLDDVAERHLSDDILLIITGEFGRTPRVKDNGGRDHWPKLSTLAFAGGGLRMGQVIGRSTAKAEEPRGDAYSLDSLFATIMHTMFDVPRLLDSNLSRDLTSLLSRGRPISELF